VIAGLPGGCAGAEVLAPAGRVVFGRDGQERLLKAQAGHLDLARPVAGVQQCVQRAVGVSRLDPHQITPDLEAHQRRQAQQECLVELAEPEGKPLGSGPLLYFRWRAVGQQTTFVDNEYPVGGLVRLIQVVRGEQQGPPSATSAFMVAQKAWRLSTSIAVVGSSSTIRSLSPTIASANLTCCAWPPDSRSTLNAM
jgi:hypothetical protein